MRVKIQGPAPYNSLQRRETGSYWRGVPPRDRTAWRLMFKDCNPYVILPTEWVSVSLNFQVRDHTDFGGLVKRKALIRPCVESFGVPIWTWQKLLGQITALEAWRACLKCNMQYNGILLKDKQGVFWRIYKDNPLSKNLSIHCYSEGREVDHSARLKKVDLRKRSNHETAQQFGRQSEMLSVPLVRMLLNIDEFVGPLAKTTGWEVSSIWRTDYQAIAFQSKALGFQKPEHLLDRLERRAEAREREQ